MERDFTILKMVSVHVEITGDDDCLIRKSHEESKCPCDNLSQSFKKQHLFFIVQGSILLIASKDLITKLV